MKPALLQIKNLKKYYFQRKTFGRAKGVLKALDDVSLSIDAGETLGIVGESGCGKTTLGRCILRLIEPTAGEVLFEGRDLLKLPNAEQKQMRRNLQVVFQDPFTSLDPRMRVGEIIGEGLVIQKLASAAERQRRIVELLDMVGLTAAYARRLPHELSGGQRQRIGIARALSLGPKLIVADEAVSALDVSIQAQILNLLRELQRQQAYSYLFISHDLRVVEYMSHRVAVMYLGKIVETAPKAKLYREARHPYTLALLDSAPVADPDRVKQPLNVSGDVPSPFEPPSGCAFHPRCPYKKPICAEQVPVLAYEDDQHGVACHVFGPVGSRR